MHEELFRLKFPIVLGLSLPGWAQKGYVSAGTARISRHKTEQPQHPDFQ